MLLDKICFKIDKTNAAAMIEGFRKNGILYRQSIWCEDRNKVFPKLLTLNKTRTRFQMSIIGNNLNPDSFDIPYKYAAILDSEFFIINDIRLWEVVCNNTLFDVWDPIAPYSRFEESNAHPSHFRIQLVRLYEINKEFSKNEVIPINKGRRHRLATWQTPGTRENPVIDDYEFQRIKRLLRTSVEGFLTAHKEY